MTRTHGLIGKFAFAAAIATACAAADAEIINLANGDKITAAIVSSTPESVVANTVFGQVSIPRSAIANISPDAAPADANAADAAPVAQAPAPAQQAEPAADETAPEPKAKEPEWITEYRNFIKQNFPEDWQFRVRGGAALKETTSTNFSVSLAFDAKKEWDLNKFEFTAFYDYTSETIDDITNRTLDKYGAETKFRRDVNKASNWYYENLLSYRRDTIKGIRDQVDEALVFGYRFDFKRYDFYIDIAPGPAVRYINADDYDTKWVAMAVVSESLHWDISKLMAFEQKLYAGFNLQKPEEYSVNLGLALLMHATEVMDIALRYTYSYDAVNADSAQKSEQTLLLSFEFPFNWK
ncbi:MAG: DUF481 domain-containing protein [Opitutales bacterium]|nr:DUF481 domain-containing protein [Opitutales bacterium]